MSADRKASPAAEQAIGIASRVTHLTPQRLTPAKRSTSAVASRGTGNHGRYHSWRAAAESSGVRPHVGTQPHQ